MKNGLSLMSDCRSRKFVSCVLMMFWRLRVSTGCGLDGLCEVELLSMCWGVLVWDKKELGLEWIGLLMGLLNNLFGFVVFELFEMYSLKCVLDVEESSVELLLIGGN